jgi:hypothetical protein
MTTSWLPTALRAGTDGLYTSEAATETTGNSERGDP